MSGSTIGGVVGGVIGFVVTGFNPAGAQWGWAIGSAEGKVIVATAHDIQLKEEHDVYPKRLEPQ